MDYRVEIVPAETVLGWIARGHLFPDSQTPLPAVTPEQACQEMSGIISGTAPPMCIVIDSRQKVIDGAGRLSVLAGALIRPSLRPQWPLPDFYQTMKIVGLDTRGEIYCECITSDNPIWLPTQSTVDTMDWLAWNERLTFENGVPAGLIGLIRERANPTLRTLTDFRVIVVRAGASVRPSDVRDAVQRRKEIQ